MKIPIILSKIFVTVLIAFSINLSASSYEVITVATNQQKPNLINPWGMAFRQGTDLPIVAANGADVILLGLSPRFATNITINTTSLPTGLVHNQSHNSKEFLIKAPCTKAYSARLLVATEKGLILGYNSHVDFENTITVIDRSAQHAVYKGLALVKVGTHQKIFAADFHNGVIDVFDHKFKYESSFTSPDIPKGFAPFNVTTFANHQRVYVLYAKQKGPDNVDDEPGPGNGFLVSFDKEGKDPRTLVAQGNLNSPWGLTLTTKGFGEFSKHLVVGNFGDGKLNVYGSTNGDFLGQISDSSGSPLVIDGLWGLLFQKNQGRLYFCAGPNNEKDGRVGYIKFVK